MNWPQCLWPQESQKVRASETLCVFPVDTCQGKSKICTARIRDILLWQMLIVNDDTVVTLKEVRPLPQVEACPE